MADVLGLMLTVGNILLLDFYQFFSNLLFYRNMYISHLIWAIRSYLKFLSQKWV